LDSFYIILNEDIRSSIELNQNKKIK